MSTFEIKRFWLRYKRKKIGVIGLVIITILSILALLAQIISPYDPFATTGDQFETPSYRHLFGTDDLGRDILSGVLNGIRTSLTIGVISSLIAMVVGVLIGSISGYFGGVIGDLLMRALDLFMTIPKLLLGIILVALFGPTFLNLIVVISLLGWPTTSRLTRAEFLRLKEQPFVDAIRTLGAGHRTLIFREILPNALPIILTNTTLEIGKAILLETGLSFLGLGDPSVMSLGTMLNNAQRFLRHSWCMSMFPGLLLFIVILTVNLLGDGLNYALNPRISGGGKAVKESSGII